MDTIHMMEYLQHIIQKGKQLRLRAVEERQEIVNIVFAGTTKCRTRTFASWLTFMLGIDICFLLPDPCHIWQEMIKKERRMIHKHQIGCQCGMQYFIANIESFYQWTQGETNNTAKDGLIATTNPGKYQFYHVIAILTSSNMQFSPNKCTQVRYVGIHVCTCKHISSTVM